MGFKNNPAYMQKQIDGLLKPFDFPKMYVDDVVIFNWILKKRAQHFHEIFGLFDKMNTALKPSKSYIDYPTMIFLQLKIDNFRLNTFADKFEIFRSMKIPAKIQKPWNLHRHD